MPATVRRITPALPKSPEHRWYPVVAEVEYKLVVDGESAMTGHTRTVSLSSTGVRFESNHVLPIGNPIELSIAWPVDLDDRVGLKCCVGGTIVENKLNLVTVEILRYEFRTRVRRKTHSKR